MNEISRPKFLKLTAAGGASFCGLPHFLQGQVNQPSSGANQPGDNSPMPAQEATSPVENKRGPLSPWARLKFTCRGGDDDDWNVHSNGDLNLIDVIREQSTANSLELNPGLRP